MKIKKALCAYEPERFKNAFGFKGNILSGVWQTVAYLCDGCDFGIGLGVQSVLWSDSRIFEAYGEEKSNKLMFDVTKFVLKYIEGAEFATPQEMTKSIFKKVYGYAREITGMPISETFVLNSLVPVDFAAWSLYCKERNINDFDEIYKGTHKSEMLANIPLITYNTPVSEAISMARDGVCIFKIKIGSDPNGDGNHDKMIEWDKKRACEIHEALKSVETEYTKSGKIVYYFDANGRYDTKDRLWQFIEHIDQKGILAQTVLFEEPFAQENEIFVGDMPICFAADESAHSLNDVKKRIDLGYRAITLKPIAKTLSVTIDMAQCCEKAGVGCFCADLTVNPVMVEWNKNFAARLEPPQGMRIGVVESNGAQNYINWEKMKGYMPFEENGDSGALYNLKDGFYKNAGGIFMTPMHYYNLVKRQNDMQ